MATKDWKPLLFWKLEGARFDEHNGVELRDLEALLQLRSILVEVAKASWRRKWNRKRIPSGAEEQIDLRVKSFDDGCVQATVLIGVPKPSGQMAFFETGAESFPAAFDDAAEALEEVVALVRDGGQLPDWFPVEVVPDLCRMLGGLSGDETVSLTASRARTLAEAVASESSAGADSSRQTPTSAPRPPIPIDHEIREKFAALSQAQEQKFRTELRVIDGEVTMVDLRSHGRLVLTDGESVRIRFNPADEDTVTKALHMHRSVRLRARGVAKLQSDRLVGFDAQAVAIVTPTPEGALGEEHFRRLSVQQPDEMVALLGTSMKPSLLTFAAEIAGDIIGGEKVVAPLLALLKHESSVVREGAVYGLRGHASEEVVTALRKAAASEKSPGVKLALQELLEEQEEQ